MVRGRPYRAALFALGTLVAGLAAAAPAFAIPAEIVDRLRAGDRSPGLMASLAKAANAGDGRASEILGYLNATGKGVPRDLSAAFRAYIAAGHAGIDGAFGNARAVWRQMSPEEKAAEGDALRDRYDAGELAAMERRWAELPNDDFGADQLGSDVTEQGDIWRLR